MEMLTLTTAGRQAIAAGARLRSGSAGVTTPPAAQAALAYGCAPSSWTSSWNVDAIAEPATDTFAVFDGKHRPTRQPSELSP